MFVVVLEKGVDGVGQFLDAAKYTSADPLCGEFTKEPFDEIQPRGRGWDEVHLKTRMPCEPGLDKGVFVPCVVS